MVLPKNILRITIPAVLSAGFLPAQAQIANFEVPTTNSHAVIKQRVAATDIEVIYNRPSVKERRIFGELVPYGKIWRTGSDASTKISFSAPVSINGNPIDAGSYEIFSIPGKTEWIIINRKNRKQWGSYAYNPEYDIVRIAAKPLTLPNLAEKFTISLDDIRSDTATLNFAWEKVRVPLQITIDIRETVVPFVAKALLEKEKRLYFRAAMFYFENNLDINRAAELMKLALIGRPAHIGMLYRLALILEQKGDMEGAIDASQSSLEAASSASTELREEYTKLNKQLLSGLKH